MKFILSLLLLVMFVSCDNPATEDLPEIKFSEDLIIFEETFIGQTETRDLKITNIGKGELTISSVDFLDKSKIDYSISAVQTSNGQNEFPVTLKKDEYLNIKILFEPTEDGEKEAVLKIKSNVRNKETINYEVKTSDLYPEIDVQKGNEPNIGELTVSVCPEGWPVEPAASKINICNLGKAPLIISKIEFSDNSGLFEIEPINLPAKISNPGLEKTCIENLSICYSKEAIPGDSTTVTIFSNSTSLENYYIQVTAGN